MNNSTKKVAVIGAGSWGTALALLLGTKGYTVNMWGHLEEEVENLQRDGENKEFLPGFPLSKNIFPSNSLKNCVKDCETVLMVVPSHGYRTVYEELIEYLEEDSCVVSATKGIENSTLMTMTQVMEDVKDKKNIEKNIELAVLSGPSFAKEVAQEIPTAITVGCNRLEIAIKLQKLLVTSYFRVYASKDTIGLEICGSLKNVVAVAAGICDGLGYGLNTRAALITRGLTEISRLGVALNADPGTFSGLSGLGDLVLTCTGDLSRNRTVGLKLGHGEKLDEIQKQMNMVAEGVKTTRSGYELAQKMKIEMPILEQVYAILYENKSCPEAVRDLLQRELKVE